MEFEGSLAYKRPYAKNKNTLEGIVWGVRTLVTYTLAFARLYMHVCTHMCTPVHSPSTHMYHMHSPHMDLYTQIQILKH